MYGEKDKSIIKVHFLIALYLKALVSISVLAQKKTTIMIDFNLVGKSWEGDISLDDIKINLGNCLTTTDECTFEHGLCDGWERGPGGTFDWSRGRNGSTPSGTPTVGTY